MNAPQINSFLKEVKNRRRNNFSVIGVTGHRDLMKGETDEIKKKVKERLEKIKQISPNGVLITALAPGADQLVTNIFQEVFEDKGELFILKVLPDKILFKETFNEFTDFDDFLASFTSRKRKDVKKERRRAIANDIHIKRFTGDEITLEHWQKFYHFYQTTYTKKSGHGGYLTPEFFKLLHDSMRDQLLLVMAYEGESPIAGALNFFDSETLYGRYWGASKDIDCLHFEV